MFDISIIMFLFNFSGLTGDSSSSETEEQCIGLKSLLDQSSPQVRFSTKVFLPYWCKLVNLNNLIYFYSKQSWLMGVLFPPAGNPLFFFSWFQRSKIYETPKNCIPIRRYLMMRAKQTTVGAFGLFGNFFFLPSQNMGRWLSAGVYGKSWGWKLQVLAKLLVISLIL